MTGEGLVWEGRRESQTNQSEVSCRIKWGYNFKTSSSDVFLDCLFLQGFFCRVRRSVFPPFSPGPQPLLPALGVAKSLGYQFVPCFLHKERRKKTFLKKMITTPKSLIIFSSFASDRARLYSILPGNAISALRLTSCPPS